MIPISTIRTLSLQVAPDGAIHLVRADTIVSMAPPFAWSPDIQARTVRCANGETILILDTIANVTSVLNALVSAPEASAVATPQITSIIPTTFPVEDVTNHAQ